MEIEEDDVNKPITEEQRFKIEQLAQDPNIHSRLVKSLAPSIWENADVKKGILC